MALAKPQHLDIAYSVTNRDLEAMSGENLRLLVEYAKGLEEVIGVVVDRDGLVVAD